MSTGAESGDGHVAMQQRHRAHGDEVEVVFVEEAPVVAVDTGNPERGGDLGGASVVGVADGDDVDVVDRRELLDVQPALEAGADDGDLHGVPRPRRPLSPS